jgi:hypothetical protein
MDLDKSSNQKLTYVIGKSPNYIDTIELIFIGSSAKIKVNGEVQSYQAICGEFITINIIK